LVLGGEDVLGVATVLETAIVAEPNSAISKPKIGTTPAEEDVIGQVPKRGVRRLKKTAASMKPAVGIASAQ
jgi:hypothetical protein